MMSYWHFYSRPAIRVEGGIKARSRRGKIGETWWSRRWIRLLESFDMGARLDRGRSYARKGQVISIEVEKGEVHARVQGSSRKPYEITICLKPIAKGGWERAEEVMASKAVFAAKLLSGEMPLEIEEAFAEAGVRLFPENSRDLETNCTCPDWANPCKHIAAVYYLLAESFDRDPFLIFKLRGRTKEEIVESLRNKRASVCLAEQAISTTCSDAIPSVKAVRPLEECLEIFWEAGNALDKMTFDPGRPEVENAVLKRLGDAPFSVGEENLSVLLEKAYQAAEEVALKKAFGENGETQEDDEELD